VCGRLCDVIKRAKEVLRGIDARAELGTSLDDEELANYGFDEGQDNGEEVEEEEASEKENSDPAPTKTDRKDAKNTKVHETLNTYRKADHALGQMANALTNLSSTFAKPARTDCPKGRHLFHPLPDVPLTLYCEGCGLAKKIEL